MKLVLLMCSLLISCGINKSTNTYHEIEFNFDKNTLPVIGTVDRHSTIQPEHLLVYYPESKTPLFETSYEAFEKLNHFNKIEIKPYLINGLQSIEEALIEAKKKQITTLAWFSTFSSRFISVNAWERFWKTLLFNAGDLIPLIAYTKGRYRNEISSTVGILIFDVDTKQCRYINQLTQDRVVFGAGDFDSDRLLNSEENNLLNETKNKLLGKLAIYLNGNVKAYESAERFMNSNPKETGSLAKTDTKDVNAQMKH